MEAYLILKKFLKCGFCKKNIKFTSDTLVINSECKCSVSIPIVDIKAIYYGIKKDKYYFMIIKKNQLFCEVCNEENILRHITLYLGEKNGEPIILHNYWGVRLKDGSKKVMGRAIITTTQPGAELSNIKKKSMLINTLTGIVNF